MALQLNKISRGILQNRRLIANSVEFVCNNKELHAESSVAQHNEAADMGIVPDGPQNNDPKATVIGLARGYSTKANKGKSGCRDRSCPRFALEGCPCVQDCPRYYKKCQKRLAPYPAYSESCVEDLDEDPSECVQCPWKHCPDFHPKFRKYHTGLNRASTSTTTNNALNTPNSVKNILNEIRLYEKKPPCQKPMGPCEKRRLLIEKLKREKDREHCERQRKRKCKTWNEAVANWYVNQNNMDMLRDEVDVKEDGLQLKKTTIIKYPVKPCEEDYQVFDYDPRESDYDHKRVRVNVNKMPCCPPKGGLIDQIDGMQLHGGYSKCPKRRQKYPDVDKTLNRTHGFAGSCCRTPRSSSCCGENVKKRKYRRSFLRKTHYFDNKQPHLSYQVPPLQPPIINLDGEKDLFEIMVKKSHDGPDNYPIDQCDDRNKCDYPPCSYTPCIHRKPPYHRSHDKSRHRDGSKIRKRPRDLSRGIYEYVPVTPSNQR